MTSHAFWHPFADMAAVPGSELVLTRGEGVYLWDEQGKRYIDGSSSLWYAHVGHGRTEIAEAVARQMTTLEAYATFGDWSNRPAMELCERLAGFSARPGSKIFLTLGGGDAVDTAAKLARQYWAVQGQPERTHLISRAYGYHGTHGFGTSLAGMEPLRAGAGPLVPAVSHVDYASPQALEDEIARLGAENVAAFFCEPVIGAGGVRPAPEGYIEAVARDLQAPRRAAGHRQRHRRLRPARHVARLRALVDRARPRGARQGHHERLPAAGRRRRQGHGRRAVLAQPRAARCSATARRTPATRPAAWPRW